MWLDQDWSDAGASATRPRSRSDPMSWRLRTSTATFNPTGAGGAAGYGTYTPTGRWPRIDEVDLNWHATAPTGFRRQFVAPHPADLVEKRVRNYDVPVQYGQLTYCARWNSVVPHVAFRDRPDRGGGRVPFQRLRKPVGHDAAKHLRPRRRNSARYGTACARVAHRFSLISAGDFREISREGFPRNTTLQGNEDRRFSPNPSKSDTTAEPAGLKKTLARRPAPSWSFRYRATGTDAEASMMRSGFAQSARDIPRCAAAFVTSDLHCAKCLYVGPHNPSAGLRAAALSAIPC